MSKILQIISNKRNYLIVDELVTVISYGHGRKTRQQLRGRGDMGAVTIKVTALAHNTS